MGLTNPTEQKKAAKAFVEHWKAKEGNEQREANSFWIELCHDVLGISSPTKHLDFERKVKGRRIDVLNETRRRSAGAPTDSGLRPDGGNVSRWQWQWSRGAADKINVMPIGLSQSHGFHSAKRFPSINGCWV